MTDDFEEPGQGGGGGAGLIAQIPSILWQRKSLIIIPTVIGAVAAVAAVLVMPQQYQSSAVLLVQSPSLPTDVIGNIAAGDIINRRIERIRQQVINRPQLAELIESNQLYPSERASDSLSSIIDKMRESIALESIEADLASNRPEDRTIAFRLSFNYSEPRKAQAITQRLMERIVEINSSTNVAQTGQTVQFLTEQATTLQREIGEIEGQIAGLNSRFGGILSRGGAPMMGSASGTYDFQINELVRANQQLALQRETARTSDNRDPAVVSAEGTLAAMRATYADSHPDVKLAQRRLEEAKLFAQQNLKKLPLDNIDQQIAFNNQQIASLRAAKANDQSAVAASLGAQAQAPLVQQQAEQLQQKLNGLYKQYDGISQRLMTAQAGARAAEEQMGERLVVIDPPVIPDDPISPNRPLILGAGLGAGLALGLLLALLVEFFLHPIRTPERIAAIIGQRTLALVPIIEEKTARRASLWKRLSQAIFRNPFRRSA